MIENVLPLLLLLLYSMDRDSKLLVSLMCGSTVWGSGLDVELSCKGLLGWVICICEYCSVQYDCIRELYQSRRNVFIKLGVPHFKKIEIANAHVFTTTAFVIACIARMRFNNVGEWSKLIPSNKCSALRQKVDLLSFLSLKLIIDFGRIRTYTNKVVSFRSLLNFPAVPSLPGKIAPSSNLKCYGQNLI